MVYQIAKVGKTLVIYKTCAMPKLVRLGLAQVVNNVSEYHRSESVAYLYNFDNGGNPHSAANTQCR